MYIYIIALVASFLLTYVIRIIAVKKSLLDIPNDRSSHAIPTPRGGGLAIAIVWFCGLFYFYSIDKINQQLFYALLPGIAISAISFLDDIFTLKASTRFIIQLLAAITSIYFLDGLQSVDLGVFQIQQVWILSFLAIIAILWFTNLFNFIDGIDGYTASEVVFIALFFGLLYHDNILLLLTAATAGFLIWNWQKAKIFMGDVGSTLLGFNIIVYAIYFQNNQKGSILLWIILSSLFWFDATYTLLKRYLNKEKLSQAHRKHAYQRIVQAGFSHQKTVLYALLINCILAGLAILSIYMPNYILIIFILSTLLVFIINKAIDKRVPFK